MKTARHTKTPWFHNERPVASYSDHGMRQVALLGREMIYIPSDRVSELKGADQANAIHIVKCVNNHEKLLDILKKVERMPIFLEGNDNALHYLIKQALQELESEA